MSRYRWNLLPPVPDQYLVSNSSVPPLIVQLLFNRGLKEPAQVASFLTSDISLSSSPLLLPDMHQAVARIYQALLSGEPVAIYGDYDADGITATALLVQGLSALGGTVIPYIPHRLLEGYGLKTAALENLRQQGIGLVVTVDCGITSLSEVKRARRMGLDIVITDHHTPLHEIPPAVAIVNPKLPGSAYPFTELTGAGVAFKLLQALYQSVGREEQLEALVDLAALGTVADMSPLLGENRYLVKEGLMVMNHSPRLGISALMEQAGLSDGNLDSGCISWIIAPRLNAAGRLEHAMSSYKLLTTDSPAEARRLARWLEQKNTERQKLTASTLARAREQVLSRGLSPLLIAGDKDYFIGIAGLVASRLAEEFYRPAVVIKTGEKVSSGSCRSIPEFNIIAALKESQHLLSQFGGHSQAAGFTLPTRNLPRFEETLLNLATTQLREVELRPGLDIDAEVTLPGLGGDTFQVTQQLAPFGRGNPVPTYLSRRVEVTDCRTMGNGGEHLRLKLRQEGARWDGVAFRLGNCLADVAPVMDIVYNLEIDRWRGKETLRLNILDFAPTGQSSGNN
ncbi:MAG TPA: single-stranded-DNA-specific exonuclease RecJ [Dehalococcoidales bacterium]|nr:single-stranded-DNA-specific exonuclease RecJ [Dehalococcoidales bacterium]